MRAIFTACAFMVFSAPAWAQLVEVPETPAPAAGKEKAGAYFKERSGGEGPRFRTPTTAETPVGTPRYFGHPCRRFLHQPRL
ncbi:MAG: hypothetical protein HC902_10285 [Calothrix sp. SM1_5_4]|nr:hypothetical protein [Calothrix sp. SM1_5_4]